jgi:UDP-GlcNAc3NAcA epimerase
MDGSKRKVVVSIVGARPQFVKLAPLATRLKKNFRHIIIHSGQHYDFAMSEAFFRQLHIPAPNINLMVGSAGHGAQTGQILERCEQVLAGVRADLVLVYGDTNTTLAGALAAAKLHIPVGHIEAGLRSFNRSMPEEINRVVADHLADLLFYPTPAARTNLLAEGITTGLVPSGDLMYELLDTCRPLLRQNQTLLESLDVAPHEYLFVTMHRAENTDDPRRLRAFVDVLESINEPILFPAHPRTVKLIRKAGLTGRINRIKNLSLIVPLPYVETLTLIANARAVLTDSGGIQKEAYFLGTPCLTLRTETEWVETVASGANKIVGLSLPKIRRALKESRRSHRHPTSTIRGNHPSHIITSAIERFLKSDR